MSNDKMDSNTSVGWESIFDIINEAITIHDDGTITAHNAKHQMVKKISPEQRTLARSKLLR